MFILNGCNKWTHPQQWYNILPLLDCRQTLLVSCSESFFGLFCSDVCILLFLPSGGQSALHRPLLCESGCLVSKGLIGDGKDGVIRICSECWNEEEEPTPNIFKLFLCLD